MSPRFVVDASIAIAWVHPAQATPESNAALAALKQGASILAPGLWPLETANTLLVLSSRGKLTQSEFDSAIKRLSELSIELDTEFLTASFTSLLNLAKKHQLTIYDAAYLELAIRKGLPIACRDSALTAAAIASGVQIWSA